MIRLTPEQRKAFDKALINGSRLVGKGRLVCANEAYDRAASDDDKNAPRFISCPCPKCSVQ
ncbi:hypothetical protein COO92_21365 [Thalassospira lohafexi]|uniref:Uncharacterized protein n=1 Tax=Thalassospira lohafexi TaxID=744227 RepID=A0A2N3L0U0_9PROT|nr:hypothetical protein COO92_21365 [Thalassospira lohafexi]